MFTLFILCFCFRDEKSPPVYSVFFGLKIVCARQAFLSLFETIILNVNGQFASLVNDQF